MGPPTDKDTLADAYLRRLKNLRIVAYIAVAGAVGSGVVSMVDGWSKLQKAIKGDPSTTATTPPASINIGTLNNGIIDNSSQTNVMVDARSTTVRQGDIYTPNRSTNAPSSERPASALNQTVPTPAESKPEQTRSEANPIQAMIAQKETRVSIGGVIQVVQGANLASGFYALVEAAEEPRNWLRRTTNNSLRIDFPASEQFRGVSILVNSGTIPTGRQTMNLSSCHTLSLTAAGATGEEEISMEMRGASPDKWPVNRKMTASLSRDWETVNFSLQAYLGKNIDELKAIHIVAHIAPVDSRAQTIFVRELKLVCGASQVGGKKLN